jgi:hypothetical protein
MNLPEPQQERDRSERDRALDGDRVMSFRTWCAINDFSVSTGRRIRRAGEGPVFTQLSERRIGVTVAANRAWQRARSVKQKSRAT